MNAPHIGALLSAYLDGETTPTEQALVEHHLVTCLDCARILTEYRSFGGGIRGLSRPTPPNTLHRDVWTAIEARQGRSVWGQSLSGVLRFGAVAAVLLLAAAVLFNLVHPQAPVAAAQMIYPHPGQTDAGKNSIVVIDFARPVAQSQDLGALVVVDNTTAKTREPYLDRQLASDGRELQIQPLDSQGRTQWWLPNTHYAVSVLTGTLFTDGSRLDHAISWQFTTGESLNTITPTATATPTATNTPLPTATHTPLPTAPPPPVQDTPLPPTAVASAPPAPPVVVTATAPPVVVTATAPLVAASETPAPGRPSAVPTAVPPKLTTTVTAPTATAPLPPATVTHAPATATSAPLPSGTPTGSPATATAGQASPTATLPAPASATAGLSTPIATRTPTTGGTTATATVRPNVEPTDTPLPTDTATPSPTRTVLPTRTAVPPTPTVTPISTQTPVTLTTCRYPVQGEISAVYSTHYALRNALGCPTTGETVLTHAASQPFEHGALFWNGDARLIYLLDGSTTAWLRYTDTWNEGDPLGGYETPPAGFYEPVRGFGKLWREQPDVRTRLGWGTAPESGLISAAIQPFDRGLIIRSDTNTVRVLYSNGAWEQYAVPQP